MLKVVITGGTYAGKTSVVNAFSTEGYGKVNEPGMSIITELRRSLNNSIFYQTSRRKV